MIRVNGSSGYLGSSGNVLTPPGVSVSVTFDGGPALAGQEWIDERFGSMSVHLGVPEARALAARLMAEAEKAERMEPVPWNAPRAEL